MDFGQIRRQQLLAGSSCKKLSELKKCKVEPNRLHMCMGIWQSASSVTAAPTAARVSPAPFNNQLLRSVINRETYRSSRAVAGRGQPVLVRSYTPRSFLLSASSPGTACSASLLGGRGTP